MDEFGLLRQFLLVCCRSTIFSLRILWILSSLLLSLSGQPWRLQINMISKMSIFLSVKICYSLRDLKTRFQNELESSHDKLRRLPDGRSWIRFPEFRLTPSEISSCDVLSKLKKKSTKTVFIQKTLFINQKISFNSSLILLIYYSFELLGTVAKYVLRWFNL